MAKPVSHQMDVYGAWLHLATDRDQWRRIKKSTGLKVGKPNSMGLTEQFTDNKTGLVQFCVFIDTTSQTPLEVIEICAHEAAHISGLMLDHVGQAYNGQSEALAYLIGWMTGWLWSGCQ